MNEEGTMAAEKKPADKAQDLKKIDADKAEQVKGGQMAQPKKTKW